ncbi:MAG: hypothetical protein JXP73_05520 [Deltaproteobacteria bacterium]|nr:hypothetical protein [Deltaproteobacteria bacterium]
MPGTLYEPPRKPLVRKRTLLMLLVLLALAGGGGYLHHRHPGWFGKAAASVLGLFGHEMVAVDVAVSPTRADILLDGERITSLPAYVRRDEATHRVTAIAPGYETTEVTFKANADRRLFLTLKPAKKR